MALAEPYGVVACITPWNSPIMNEAQQAAPALAAGNAVLIKPSEETPQLAIELVRISTEAGLHAGQIGRASCREKVVKYVSIPAVAGILKKKKHKVSTKQY